MQKVFFLITLFLTACSFAASPTPQATKTINPVLFSTATLISTFTPRPTSTPVPATITLTISPVFGNLTSQVNVRSAPDKQAMSLGLIDYGKKVRILGKDVKGLWLQIVYPEVSNSTGWVSASYVQVSEADLSKIAVLQPDDGNSSIQTPSPYETRLQSTPSLPSETPTRTARVKNQIFVRAGPGSSFATLATINVNTVVIVTGRNQNNIWVQINFDGAPEGKGWLAAAYLDGADLKGLPYYDNQGNLIPGGTSVANPGQATLTPTTNSPAISDGDSEQNPAVRLKFSPDSGSSFTYSSDLSSPSGDAVDWVLFTPYEITDQSTYVFFKLECSGNGGITALLEQDGIPVPDVNPLVCGNYDFGVKVLGGKDYMLILRADGSGSVLRYVRYSLYITTQD